MLDTKMLCLTPEQRGEIARLRARLEPAGATVQVHDTPGGPLLQLCAIAYGAPLARFGDVPALRAYVTRWLAT